MFKREVSYKYKFEIKKMRPTAGIDYVTVFIGAIVENNIL